MTYFQQDTSHIFSIPTFKAYGLVTAIFEGGLAFTHGIDLTQDVSMPILPKNSRTIVMQDGRDNCGFNGNSGEGRYGQNAPPAWWRNFAFFPLQCRQLW